MDTTQPRSGKKSYYVFLLIFKTFFRWFACLYKEHEHSVSQFIKFNINIMCHKRCCEIMIAILLQPVFRHKHPRCLRAHKPKCIQQQLEMGVEVFGVGWRCFVLLGSSTRYILFMKNTLKHFHLWWWRRSSSPLGATSCFGSCSLSPDP